MPCCQLCYTYMCVVSSGWWLCDNLNTMNIKLKLAKRLKQLRCKKDLTQEGLADRAGLAYKHIQRLESKKPNAAKIGTLEKLAKAFGISVSELLDFD